MFSLNVDDRNNKLIITFSGHFDLKQAEQYYQELQQILPKLKKGVKVLTDLSSLEHMDRQTVFFVQKTMDLLNEKGTSKVIRIIPDPKKDIGFNIMSVFHYSQSVAVHTYRSYQEAEKHFVSGN